MSNPKIGGRKYISVTSTESRVATRPGHMPANHELTTTAAKKSGVAAGFTSGHSAAVRTVAPATDASATAMPASRRRRASGVRLIPPAWRAPASDGC
jgi:hypothetical protein